MITNNFFSLDYDIGFYKRDEIHEVTHCVIEGPGRWTVRYKKLDEDPVQIKTKTYNFTEALIAGSDVTPYRNTWLSPRTSFPEGPLRDVLLKYAPLEQSYTAYDVAQRYHQPHKIYETMNLVTKHNTRVEVDLDEHEFPKYVIWPENEAQELLDADEILYPYYGEQGEDVNGLMNYTPAETRLATIDYVYRHLMEEARNIIAFSQNDYEKEAAQIYVAFLYNVGQYMMKESNRTNNSIWEEWLKIPDIDTFFSEFPISQSKSTVNQQLKTKLYSHKRIYGYGDGTFTIRRSSIVSENPSDIPDNTPVLGGYEEVSKVRDLMELHPLVQHMEARLDDISLTYRPRNLDVLRSFDADTFSYTATIDTDTIMDQSVTKKYDLQTVVFDGKLRDFEVGTEDLTWTVISADGQNSQVYTMTLTVVADN